MEPEPEYEKQAAAAAAAAAEAPDESAVAAARVGVAGHEVVADTTALDVSEWGLTAAQVREVAGALPQLLYLQELVLDRVPVRGSTPRRGNFRWGVETLDADLGTFRALCEGLRTCQKLTALSLKKCFLGPQALVVLAEVTFREASAAVKKVALSHNDIIGLNKYGRGTEDLSGFEQLCDVVGILHELDLSNCNLYPAAMTIFAVKVTWAEAALKVVNLSGCPLTGATYHGGGVWTNIDSDMSGFVELCGVLGKLNEVNLSDCHLGPTSTVELAKVFSDADAALKSLTLDSTGLPKQPRGSRAAQEASGPRTYTLMVGEVTIDLSQKNLGPADVTVLTAWIQRPEVSAAVKKIVLSTNFLFGSKLQHDTWGDIIHTFDADQSGWNALCDALPGSPVEDLDVADVGIGVTGVTSLAKAISAGAAVKKVALNGNMITGSKNDGTDPRWKSPVPGRLDLAGVVALGKAVVTSKTLTSMDLSECGISVAGVTKVAKFISAAAALKSLKMAGANFGEIYATDGLVFRVSDERGVAFRNSPNMDDRREDIRGPGALQIVHAMRQTDEWIQVTERKWLPKKFFVQVDTSTPCAFQAFCDALRPSRLTEVDISSCGLGPAEMPILSDYVRDATAVLNEINVSKNPIGVDGATALSNAIPESSLQWIVIGESSTRIPLHNSEITSLDVSDQQLGPPEVTVVAAAISTYAAINSLTVDSTGVMEDEYGRAGQGTQKPYTLTTGDVTINLSQKNLGPADVTLLTVWIQRPEVSAVLKKVTLSQNKLFGATRYGHHYTIDADQSGWAALCDALPSSPVVELDVADVGMGVKGVTSLAKAMSAGAALEVLAVGNNPIGSEGGSALVAAVKTSNLKIIDIGKPLPVQEPYESQTLDVSQTGMRPGQVVILSWWLTTPFSAAVKKVVLSQNFLFGTEDSDRGYSWNTTIHDVDADQSGWGALCDALPGSPLEELDVSDIGMGVTGVTSLAKAISAGAAVNEVNVSQNPIGVEGGKALANVIPQCLSLRWIVVGKAARIPVHNSEVTSIDASGQELGPGEVTVLAAAISTDAAIAHIALSGNVITGSTNVGYPFAKYDLDLTGIIALGEAVVVSTTLTSIDLSKCGISVAGVTEVAKFISAGAAIEKVNVSGCDVTQEAAAQLLTAANRASRARLRAHQVLAFSEALHARLGSECLLQAVTIDANVWRRVAENVRERHGHELMCSQLAQAGQTWFEVTVEGLVAEGIPS